MAVQPVSIETTFDAMRQRAIRLEQEAAALRSDLDEMAVLIGWQTNHSISPETLQKIAVSEAELTAYRDLVGSQFPDTVLRLILRAQKAATRLKQSLPSAERETAIRAVLDALKQVTADLGLTIPDELEAAIGD